MYSWSQQQLIRFIVKKGKRYSFCAQFCGLYIYLAVTMKKRPDQPIRRPIKQRLNESGYLNVLGVIIAIILLALLFFFEGNFLHDDLELRQTNETTETSLKARPSEELEPQFDVQENLDQETINN